MEPDLTVRSGLSSGRIYLLGIMGVGKSTLGKQLARQLHYSFLDLDKAIEKAEGKTVNELFDQFGEQFFRTVERKALLATAERTHLVVATGGGTPCYHQNIEWMNRHGKTIYLRANAAFVASRVSRFPERRPLLKGKSPDEITRFIDELIEARSIYYCQAHLQVDVPVKSLLDAVKSMD